MDRLEVVQTTTTGRVYFRAPQGRPSATPTVAIQTEAAAVLSAAATTNVTLLGPATTLSASAAVGVKQITLTAVTDVLAERWLKLTNSLGQSDNIKVRGFTSAGVVDLEAPLEFAYTVDRGSSDYGDCESLDFYYELQTADVADLAERNVAIAVYTVGGLSYSQRVLFDVVLYPLPNPLTVDKLYQRWPDIAGIEPHEQTGSDYKPQRDLAWDRIKRNIRRLTYDTGERYEKRRRWRPAMIVDVSELFEAGMAQLKVHLAEIGVDVHRSPDGLTEAVLAQIQNAADHAWFNDSRSISWLDISQDESRADEGEMIIPVDFVG